MDVVILTRAATEAVGIKRIKNLFLYDSKYFIASQNAAREKQTAQNSINTVEPYSKLCELKR